MHWWAQRVLISLTRSNYNVVSLWVQLQISSSKVHSLKGTWPAKARRNPKKYNYKLKNQGTLSIRIFNLSYEALRSWSLQSSSYRNHTYCRITAQPFTFATSADGKSLILNTRGRTTFDSLLHNDPNSMRISWFDCRNNKHFLYCNGFYKFISVHWLSRNRKL